MSHLGRLPLTLLNYLYSYIHTDSLDYRVDWLRGFYNLLAPNTAGTVYHYLCNQLVHAIVPELWSFEKSSDIRASAQKTRSEVLFDSVSARDNLTKDELGRLRFRQTNMPSVMAVTPALTLEWQLYRHTLSLFQPKALRYLINTYSIDTVMVSTDAVTLLTRISDREKKKGGKFSKLCIDLATLGGYQVPDDSRNMEIANGWFGIAKKKGYPGWMEKFGLAIDKVLGDYFINELTMANYLTIQQYAAAPILWGTSGSVLYYKNVHIHGTADGKVFSAKNTKWAAGVDIDPVDVERSMRTRRAQYCKMVHKSETKKVRQVVSSDLENHWKMDYISQVFLDPLSSGSKLSTLSMSGKDTVEMWVGSAVFNGSVRCPLDQSAFDQEQTKDMIVLLMTKIRALVMVKIAGLPMLSDEIGKIFDDAIYGMSHGYVLVDGNKVPYRNGVLSGWRWTAMVDSLLNAATFYVPLLSYNLESSLLNVVSQGDDIKSDFDNWIVPVVVWHDIQRAGFIVNPSKFFIADDRDEFLRKTMAPGRVDAYPARSVNSIFFRNPVNSPPAPGALRVGEMISQWNLFLGRIDVSYKQLSGTAYWDMVLKDIAAANQVTSRDVDNWMHTPLSLGGGGYVPHVHHSKWRAFDTSVALEDPEVSLTPAVRSVVTIAKQISSDITMSEVVKSMSKRVTWKGLTYSRTWIVNLSSKLVALDYASTTPVNMTRSGTVPLFSKKLSRLDRMIYSMSEKAAASIFTSASGTKRFSTGVKSDLVLSRLTLPVPKVFGISNMFNSYFIDSNLLGPAINTFVSMRRPTRDAWLVYQLRFELAFVTYRSDKLGLRDYMKQLVVVID